jgi:thioredoxin 1
MNARKRISSIVVIAAIIAVIAVMWFVKNGTKPVDQELTVNAENALLSGELDLTAPFDLAEYRSAGVPVIIDFGADSCIPCKEMAPVLLALHKEIQGKAIIRFVDVWKYRDLAEGIPLQVIPTQVFIDSNGNPYTPSKKLQVEMKQYLTKETNEHVFTTHEGGLTKDQLLSILVEMGIKK